MNNSFNLDDITTRPCVSTDSDYIYNLKKLTLKPYVEKIWGWNEDWNLKHFSETFNPNNYTIVIYIDEKIGCFSVVDKEECIEIENIEIHPKYQGIGIGSKMINKIKQLAVTHKKEVILQVFKINVKAIEFYSKLGFNKYDASETHLKMRYNKR